MGSFWTGNRWRNTIDADKNAKGNLTLISYSKKYLILKRYLKLYFNSITLRHCSWYLNLLLKKLSLIAKDFSLKASFIINCKGKAETIGLKNRIASKDLDSFWKTKEIRLLEKCLETNSYNSMSLRSKRFKMILLKAIKRLRSKKTTKSPHQKKSLKGLNQRIFSGLLWTTS